MVQNRTQRSNMVIEHSVHLWWRALIVWLLLMGEEALNGLWSMRVLAIWLGDFLAGQVCIFTGSLLILLITYVCISSMGASKTRTLLSVGLVWVGLTLVLEMSVEYLVMARPLQYFVSDFDMFHSGHFPIGLTVVILAPLLAARWRRHVTLLEPLPGRS
jgi:hypothetical protein